MSEFDDSPLPFQRFLEHIEAEPIIREYINDCTNLHTPEGFSAISQCDEVAANYYGTFGPFSTDSQEESSQVNQATRQSIVNATQQNGVAPQKLSKILNEVFDAARSELGNGETLQDIEENLTTFESRL